MWEESVINWGWEEYVVLVLLEAEKELVYYYVTVCLATFFFYLKQGKHYIHSDKELF